MENSNNINCWSNMDINGFVFSINIFHRRLKKMINMNYYEYLIWIFTILSSFGVGLTIGYYQQWKALDHKRYSVKNKSK